MSSQEKCVNCAWIFVFLFIAFVVRAFDSQWFLSVSSSSFLIFLCNVPCVHWILVYVSFLLFFISNCCFNTLLVLFSSFINAHADACDRRLKSEQYCSRTQIHIDKLSNESVVPVDHSSLSFPCFTPWYWNGNNERFVHFTVNVLNFIVKNTSCDCDGKREEPEKYKPITVAAVTIVVLVNGERMSLYFCFLLVSHCSCLCALVCKWQAVSRCGCRSVAITAAYVMNDCRGIWKELGNRQQQHRHNYIHAT